MSLKIFHIFFITISILLSIGVGVWMINASTKEGSPGMYIYLGISALIASGGLVQYAVSFVKKMKETNTTHAELASIG